ALVRLARPPASPTDLALRAPDGREVAAAPLAADSSIAVLRLAPDAPVGRYALIARSAVGETRLGDLALGREYAAESFPIRFSDLPGPGWSLYEQSFYGRQFAARTNVPAVVARPIQPLPPGRYTVLA